ncbi:MAG: hypothetical protein LBT84_05595, partial [Spirochaetia bacterium]|nr:hypothetical protein [Spirochaetia bacterium]
MKTGMLKKRVLLSALFCALSVSVPAQQNQPETLSDIASAVDGYIDKSVTMTLKLRNINRVFFTITFYDSNNHDILFDISQRAVWKKFGPAIVNAHEGMNYKVSFIVKG